MNIVIDTNVVMDLFHFGNPDSRPIHAALLAGQVCALADARTLAELRRVVTYPAFKLDATGGEAVYAAYAALIHTVAEGEPPPLPRCKDRDDQKFLELAARANAELLISKDNALLKLRGRTRLPFPILGPQAASDYILRRNTQAASSDASGTNA